MTKKSRTGLIVGGLILLCLVVGFAVAVALGLVAGTGTSLEVTSCVIEADGTLKSTGTVSGDDSGSSVTVDFVDSASSKLIDSAEVSIDPSSGSTDWTASAQAGDEVEKVVCKAHI